MENLGIKETKEVLTFGLKIANATDKSLSDDGKITISEWPNYIGAVTSFPAALSDIKQVPAELADLDESERDEIIQLIKDELDLSNDTTEDKIEAIFAEAMAITVSIIRLIGVIKS